MKRKHISLKVKLAAALLDTNANSGDGCITYEASKKMTAEQIISRFHFDHYPIHHSSGGSDEPWNLNPKLVEDHRKKTAKVDIPQMAKADRIKKRAMFDFDAPASVREDGDPIKFKRRIPSRPFPKGRKVTACALPHTTSHLKK